MELSQTAVESLFDLLLLPPDMSGHNGNPHQTSKSKTRFIALMLLRDPSQFQSHRPDGRALSAPSFLGAPSCRLESTENTVASAIAMFGPLADIVPIIRLPA